MNLVRECELQTNAEMSRMAARSAAHLLNSTTFAKSVIEGAGQPVRDEPKRIEEVALARPVGTDQNYQGAKRDVAALDAAEILQNHSVDEHRPGRGRHG